MQVKLSKREAVEALLQKDNIKIIMDARRDGVVVPQQFQACGELVLCIGLSTLIPIPDLEVGDIGIAATLSFERTPHKCFIPWTSLYAVVLDAVNQCLIFTADVPADVKLTRDPNVTLEELAKPVRLRKKVVKKKAPVFQLLVGGKPVNSDQPVPKLEAVQHLRVVK